MKCEGCIWWSELMAEVIGCGPLKAMCLNENSDNHKKMVNSGCEEREEGEPVDSPY